MTSKPIYKHEKKEAKEFTSLSKRVGEALIEARQQRSLILKKPSTVQDMESNKLHIFKNDSGATKMQIKIDNKLYEVTLTEIP